MTGTIDPPPAGDPIWERALLCAEAALEKKAFEVTILDVRGLTSIADYFVLASARSDTQVRAIAEFIEETCRKHELSAPLSVEGRQAGQWVLLDFGDLVVHVFYHPVRAFYDLERLWSQAGRPALPAALELARQANDLQPSFGAHPR